ncbi:MAG: DUF6577 family protein [Bacteroidota bacterium]
MAIINQVEKAIKEIDPAMFGKLCTGYFRAQGYMVTDDGDAKGISKTRKGNPDAYIALSAGEYYFLQFTTVQEKRKLYKKLKKDVIDSFKKIDTIHANSSSNSRVSKIFLCYNETISIEYREKLLTIAKEYSSIIYLEFVDIDKLSIDLIRDFPDIVWYYLGIQVDSLQIFSLHGFQTKFDNHKIKIPHSYDLFGREDELEKAYSDLEENDLIVLTGKAGVGKTRLALEIGRKYCSENPDVQFRIIDFKGRDRFFDDLHSHLHRNQSYVVLVDDANRLLQSPTQVNHLEETLELAFSEAREKIKLIYTVRDFKREEIVESIDPRVKKEFVHLSPVNSGHIHDFLKKTFDFLPDISLKITQLSQGNFRLAVMAALRAEETNQLKSIKQVIDLYEAFYIDHSKQLSNFSFKILGLLAFFQIWNFKKESNLIDILKHFDLDTDLVEVKSELSRLSYHEFVQIYSKQYVKIEDEVFATYVIYRAFVKDGLLSLSSLLSYKPDDDDQAKLLKSAIIPLFNQFDFEFNKSIFIEPVRNRWKVVKQSKQSSFRFLELFWFLLPDETLEYVYEEIESLPIDNNQLEAIRFDKIKQEENPYLPTKNRTLKILFDFCRSLNEQFETGLEMMFLYLSRDKNILSELITYFRYYFAYNYEDCFRIDYLRQRKLVRFFLNQIQQSTPTETILHERVFLGLIPKLWELSFEKRSHLGKGMYFQQGKTAISDSFIKLRKSLWDFLFKYYQNNPDETLTVIREYHPTWNSDQEKKIIAEELSQLLTFLFGKLETDDLSEELFFWIDSLIKIATRLEDAFDKSLLKRFQNSLQSKENLKIYHLFKANLAREGFKKIDDILEERRIRIREYFKSADGRDYERFLQALQEISVAKGNNSWVNIDLINGVFVELLDKNRSLGVEKIKRIISSPLIGFISSGQIIDKLFEVGYSSQTIYELLDSQLFSRKTNWRLTFFYQLPESNISNKFLDSIKRTIAETQKLSLFIRLHEFEKYERFSYGFFEQIIQLLIDKNKTDGTIFIVDPDFWKLSFNELNIPILLLEILYLQSNIQDQEPSWSFMDWHLDFVGLKALLSHNIHFLATCIEELIKRYGLKASEQVSHFRFDFIWELDQAEEIIELSLLAFKEVPHFISSSEHPISVLLKYDVEDSRKQAILIRFIDKHHSVSDMMSALFNGIFWAMSEEMLLMLLGKYLHIEPQNNLVAFKSFNITYTGSYRIDRAEELFRSQIEFWQKVKDSLIGISFLKHRSYISKKIDDLQQKIASRKEDDFIGYTPGFSKTPYKPSFIPIITPNLLRLYDQLKRQWPLADIALWHTQWISDWMIHQPFRHYLILEIDEDVAESAFYYLNDIKSYNGRTFLNPTSEDLTLYANDHSELLLIRPVSEQILNIRLWKSVSGIRIPRLEKILIDLERDDIFSSFLDSELQRIVDTSFQHHLENSLMHDYEDLQYEQTIKHD